MARHLDMASQHAVDGRSDAAVVQVGADAVRREPVVDRPLGVAEPEAGGAVAQVEPDPARPRLPHVRIDAPLGIDDGKLAREDVGVDVARAELLQDQVRIGTLRRPGPEIDHHRHVAQPAGLDRPLHRLPRRVLGIEREAGPVMRGLDPDHDVPVLQRRLRGGFRVQVRDDLLGVAHSRPRDVDQGEDARDGAVDHASAGSARSRPLPRFPRRRRW